MTIPAKIPMPRLTRNLSARLLVLTIAFVMLGEVLIYVPSVSRYRLVFLQERLAAAHEATLALEASPDGMITPELEAELLRHARVRSIALRMPDAAYLMLGTPPDVDAAFDLREETAAGLIRDAFVALAQTGERVLRVTGTARNRSEGAGRRDARRSADARRDVRLFGPLLILSIVLSLMTASLVYLSLHWLIVRPMRRVTASLVAFRETPEDTTHDMPATDRSDEIGVAQREVTVMQHDLRAALKQRAHLAALGAAVGKITHDLRNILTTAMLASERLAHSDEPEIQRQSTALTTAIDRAVALCEDTLRFARAGEPQPKRVRLRLKALFDDVGKALALSGRDAIRWRVEIDDGLTVTADRDQLFRVVFNLGQNAVEAMNGAGEVRIEGRRDEDVAVIEFADTGPGLPDIARAHLFEPFAGSTRADGTGLGLSIAREIMRAHGGDIHLVASDADGTTFRLDLPAD